MEQDDCGEGVHLIATTSSTIIHNTVEGNAGGILLTDETGPTHDNVINGNMVVNNPYDCGITLASHVVSPGATVSPTVGGIYNNTIVNNTSMGNGGAGAGIFAAAPGAAAYNNTVSHNILGNNGLPGASIHSHSPNQNVSGNTIVNNIIWGNAADGEEGIANVQPGPTGIDVLSDPGASPIAAVTIAGNRISGEYYGIFTANVLQVNGLPSNQIGSDVTVPIFPQ